MARVVKVVIIRILKHMLVEVGPSEYILEYFLESRKKGRNQRQTHHSILLVLDHLHRDLGEEIIVQQIRWQV